MLHVACGNRRETVCPACSAVYKRDARQLVLAGLVGGKGIPESVAAHPCVFATLTAPSFGPVHARRKRGKTVLPCRPRRDANDRRCPHGRDISCPVRHADDRPPARPPAVRRLLRLRSRRAVQPARRRPVASLHHLPAPPPGPPGRASPASGCAPSWRIRFVKVAEYQARGVVHFHAVIRLDAPGNRYAPPPPRYTAALLCDAITLAARTVRHRRARLRRRVSGSASAARLDKRPIWREPVRRNRPAARRQAQSPTTSPSTPPRAADVPGLPDTRIRHASEIARAALPGPPQAHGRDRVGARRAHLGRRSAAAAVGAHARLRRPLPHQIPPLRRHLRLLRGERVTKRRLERHPDGERDPWDRPLDDTVVLVIKTWTYAGTGYSNPSGAELALSSAARAREHRWLGREESTAAS